MNERIFWSSIYRIYTSAFFELCADARGIVRSAPLKRRWIYSLIGPDRSGSVGLPLSASIGLVRLCTYCPLTLCRNLDSETNSCWLCDIYFVSTFCRPALLTHLHILMASSDALESSLTESQLQALETFTAVTNQESSQAIPLLQRSEWNVQVYCGDLYNHFLF